MAEHVRGNEQATKQSLVGPLFTLLGYDLTDPRECVPEFKADFGKERSIKPVDWAFIQLARPIFFVEAKEASRKLAGYDEQLADYFAKCPDVKLGILANGVQWRFFTDVTHENVMDVEPFLKWDVLSEEAPPLDFLTLLQKSQFNPQLIRTFAKQKRNQNLLLNEISRLLEPSGEFVRLAISNLETRKLTENVVESWKPVLAAALQEWVKQSMLVMALDFGSRADSQAGQTQRVETTPEELEGFAIVQRLLGAERPVAYEDTISYFKIHLKERYTWVMCRFYFGRKRPTIWVPLAIEEAQPLSAQFPVMTPQLGWTCRSVDSPKDLESLGDLFRRAYDQQRASRVKAPDTNESPKAEASLAESGEPQYGERLNGSGTDWRNSWTNPGERVSYQPFHRSYPGVHDDWPQSTNELSVRLSSTVVRPVETGPTDVACSVRVIELLCLIEPINPP